MQYSRLTKLHEFLNNEPDDPFLKYALATEYLSLSDTGKALEYFTDLVTNHPEYVGTYYHLGKLYEGLEQKDAAIKIYQTGMQVARAARNNHALSELQAVYNLIMGLDYEDD
ncbi:MAG TPA: tetratricopeptide repeat protein [Sphingobacteriaceae bacterium]|nr:tetratricopeptide repeat protein [Sphingobacteriaceae bacterium]